MEADEVVTSKPIASRLTRTRFTTFSELLAGAMGPSPFSTCTTIRPKAVRFKQSRTPVGAVPFQGEATGASTYGSYDGVLNSDHRSAKVYKPVTKLPSRRTISLLANLGEPRSSHQQTIAAQVEDHIQHENQDKHHFGTRLASKLCRSHLTAKNRTPELSETATENLEGDDKRPLPPSISIERPPYDGYNWRKYGQKRVKGSEYPRSYYTCTHPSCPVKKKVERSLDHQIAEIVYKGEHNHSKPQPQPPKNDSSGSQGQGFASDGTGQNQNSTSRNNNRIEKNGSCETRVANQVEVGSSSHSTYTEKTPLFNNLFKTGAINAASDSTCRLSGESETVSKKVDDEEPRSKRRRRKSQPNVAAESEEGAQETPIIVQNSTEAKTFGDGFRWRKYGQKVVKGNPYPRSYYRCTTLKCNARKHVEGSSHDPDTFITTYEGRHNHDMPRRATKAGTF